MAMIPKKTALLIVCRALNPFVNFDLLRPVPGGGQEPVPGVGNVRIGDVLLQLDFHDHKLGLHVIDFIVQTITSECLAAGYTIVFGPAQLVIPPVPVDIAEVVTRVRSGSEKA